MNENLRNLALSLLKVGAVNFGTFKSTGHEKNPNLPALPIYFNLRILRSEPEVRDEVVNAYEEKIFAEGLDLEIDFLVDIPLAISPIVSILSYKTGIPMITPRKEDKTHGIPRKIEGRFRAGQRVLVIDDVITWGVSKFEVLDILKEESLRIKGILVLIDLEKGGAQAVGKAGYCFYSVFKATDLLSIYLEENKIDQRKYDETIARLKKQ